MSCPDDSTPAARRWARFWRGVQHSRLRWRAWRRQVARPVWRMLRWPAYVLLTLVVVCLGYRGFQLHFAWAGVAADRSDVFYRAVQLFVLEWGGVEGWVPWQLEWARILAPLLAARAAMAALAVVFRRQVEELALFFISGHVIVCGVGRKGVQLVKDFCRAGHKVVAIEADKENDNLDLCRDEGALVIEANATDGDVLRRARAYRARYVVAVCGDDRANLEIALQVHALVERGCS